MKRLVAFALGLAIAATGSASAQEESQQTIDGAVRFFDAVAGSHYLRIIPSYYASPNLDLAYQVTGFTAIDECRTAVSIGEGWGSFSRGAEFTVGALSSSARARFENRARSQGVALPPYVVDWSKVSRIARVDSAAASFQGVGPPQFRFILVEGLGTKQVFAITGDDAIMRRMIYAMEFLKVACDRTAETGF